jgi:hypothetical protein
MIGQSDARRPPDPLLFPPEIVGVASFSCLFSLFILQSGSGLEYQFFRRRVLLLTTEHAANDGQTAGATAATFLLALLASEAERAGDAAETEATEQLVDTKSTEQTIDKST